ncbi:MAG: hypothetical protein QXV46_01895 [Candidatus Bathyarchaeia archaeon]
MTCLPPELIATVSAPLRSVIWTIVLLKDEYMFAIPQCSAFFSDRAYITITF